MAKHLGPKRQWLGEQRLGVRLAATHQADQARHMAEVGVDPRVDSAVHGILVDPQVSVDRQQQDHEKAQRISSGILGVGDGVQGVRLEPDDAGGLLMVGDIGRRQCVVFGGVFQSDRLIAVGEQEKDLQKPVQALTGEPSRLRRVELADRRDVMLLVHEGLGPADGLGAGRTAATLLQKLVGAGGERQQRLLLDAPLQRPAEEVRERLDRIEGRVFSDLQHPMPVGVTDRRIWHGVGIRGQQTEVSTDLQQSALASGAWRDGHLCVDEGQQLVAPGEEKIWVNIQIVAHQRAERVDQKGGGVLQVSEAGELFDVVVVVAQPAQLARHLAPTAEGRYGKFVKGVPRQRPRRDLVEKGLRLRHPPQEVGLRGHLERSVAEASFDFKKVGLTERKGGSI